MTTEAALDPEGVALVAAIHARKLTRDLAAAQANHDRLVSEAAALGVKPGARFAWELVHEAAGITAQLQSRLQQTRWTPHDPGTTRRNPEAGRQGGGRSSSVLRHTEQRE